MPSLLAKALDSSRLVISNDGWEMVDSDICAIHTYMHGGPEETAQHKVFADSLKQVDTLYKIMEKIPYAKGHSYAGQPVAVTECGGISVLTDAPEASREEAIGVENRDWGYTSASQQGFIDEYARVIGAIYESEIINGFCYTQLTDVEQETNGLLTKDHQYKFDPEEIKKINDRKR